MIELNPTTRLRNSEYGNLKGLKVSLGMKLTKEIPFKYDQHITDLKKNLKKKYNNGTTNIGDKNSKSAWTKFILNPNLTKPAVFVREKVKSPENVFFNNSNGERKSSVVPQVKKSLGNPSFRVNRSSTIVVGGARALARSQGTAVGGFRAQANPILKSSFSMSCTNGLKIVERGKKLVVKKISPFKV